MWFNNIVTTHMLFLRRPQNTLWTRIIIKVCLKLRSIALLQHIFSDNDNKLSIELTQIAITVEIIESIVTNNYSNFWKHKNQSHNPQKLLTKMNNKKAKKQKWRQYILPKFFFLAFVYVMWNQSEKLMSRMLSKRGTRNIFRIKCSFLLKSQRWISQSIFWQGYI